MTTEPSPRLERLKELAALEQDWDGYGAPPVDPRALAAVDGIIERFRQCVGTEPWIVPTLGGGIQIEWHIHGFDVEIEIDAAGEHEADVGVWGRQRQGHAPCVEDDADYSQVDWDLGGVMPGPTDAPTIDPIELLRKAGAPKWLLDEAEATTDDEIRAMFAEGGPVEVVTVGPSKSDVRWRKLRFWADDRTSTDPKPHHLFDDRAG